MGRRVPYSPVSLLNPHRSSPTNAKHSLPADLKHKTHSSTFPPESLLLINTYRVRGGLSRRLRVVRYHWTLCSGKCRRVGVGRRWWSTRNRFGFECRMVRDRPFWTIVPQAVDYHSPYIQTWPFHPSLRLSARWVVKFEYWEALNKQTNVTKGPGATKPTKFANRCYYRAELQLLIKKKPTLPVPDGLHPEIWINYSLKTGRN